MRYFLSTGCARTVAIFLGFFIAFGLTACGGGKGSFADLGAGDATGSGGSPVPPSGPSASSPSTGNSAGPAVGAMTLAWISPTTKADGTPLADLAGFRILLGTTSGVYSQTITVASPYAQTYAITGLPQNTYYAVVKAFDSENNESSASAEVSKVVK